MDTIQDDSLSLPSLSFQESILNDSRLTPVGNGDPFNRNYTTQPTSGQKWWASVLLGFVFALISSPPAYYLTSSITNTKVIPEINVRGLLLHTIIFIIVIRIILW